MIKSILARTKLGKHTIVFPESPPTLPEKFCGRPNISAHECQDNCSECIDECPTTAISLENKHPLIDLGRCIFCRKCENVCPSELIKFSNDYSLASNNRDNLLSQYDNEKILIKKLHNESLRLFKRSLQLRVVSAGGCNGCEVEVNVLGTIVYDLGRFGIQFVASPRHADGLLITGPVTENMQLALMKTYEAIPSPKIVIALGACAISGGPYVNHKQVHNGAQSKLPIDLYIPGCPPHPITILDGLLKFLGKIDA